MTSKTPPPRKGLNLRRDAGCTCTEITAYQIDVSPGDMTRYRLTVTPALDGGLLVAWEGQPSLWWALDTRGGEVVPLAGARKGDGLQYDAQMLRAILDEYVRMPQDEEVKS